MLNRLLPVLMLLAAPLWAAEVKVMPGAGTLSQAIAGASPGDVLLLTDGVYKGPVIIDKPLTVIGPDRRRDRRRRSRHGHYSQRR